MKSNKTDRALASMTLRLWGVPGFSAKLKHEMILVRSDIEDFTLVSESHNEENFYSLLDKMVVHHRLPPPTYFVRILLGGVKQCE